MRRTIVLFLAIALMNLNGGLIPIAAGGQVTGQLTHEDKSVYYAGRVDHLPPRIQQDSGAAQSKCEATMETVYASASRRLNSKHPTSEQQLSQAINVALGKDKRAFGPVVLQIEQGARPAWFVGFSCGLSVTDAYSTFRIFKAFNGKYRQMVTSGQFPVLKQFGKLEIPIDHAVIEAQLLRSSDSEGRTYILTNWVRVAMSPAQHSMFLWEWDGQRLRLVWQLIGLLYESVMVIDHLLLITRLKGDPRSPTTAREAEPYYEVYRLRNRKLVKDGLFTRESAGRYLREGLIRTNDPDSLMKFASMLSAIGDKEGAIRFYKQVIRLDPKRPLPYMMLSGLYEQLGQYDKAVEYMERFATVVGALNAYGEQQLEKLKRKAEQQRQR